MHHDQSPNPQPFVSANDTDDTSQDIRGYSDDHLGLKIQGTHQLGALNKREGGDDEQRAFGTQERSQDWFIVELGHPRCDQPDNTKQHQTRHYVKTESSRVIILGQIGLANQSVAETTVKEGEGNSIKHAYHCQQAIVAWTQQSCQDNTDYKAKANARQLIQRRPGNTLNSLLL